MKEKYNFLSLDNMEFLKRIFYVVNVWKENNLIIVNGYNNYVFLLLWILNLFSKRKKILALNQIHNTNQMSH